MQQRLQELGIDFYYQDTNLKENLFFFLTPDQTEKIEKLQRGEVIELDLSQVFDREILKYAYGFSSEVMDIMRDKFELPPINLNNLKTIEKILSPKKYKPKDNFRELVIQDIRNAIAKAKNEKEFKKILIDSKSYHKVVTN